MAEGAGVTETGEDACGPLGLHLEGHQSGCGGEDGDLRLHDHHDGGNRDPRHMLLLRNPVTSPQSRGPNSNPHLVIPESI